LKADPTNAYSLLGLATTVFIKKDFSHARNLFLKALRFSDSGIFRDVKELILLELARTEFYLGNYDKAKQYLLRYRQFNTLNPEYYDLLGQIAEKKQKFEEAVYFYHDALILGHRGFDAVLKMIKVAKYCGNKNNMLKHCFKTFSSFWKEFKLLKKDKVLSSREKRKLQKIRSLLSYK
jgi:tetratricopeptide (TPR) repeat protein